MLMQHVLNATDDGISMANLINDHIGKQKYVMRPITKETRLREIKYLSDGLSNRKIADIIGVNSKTVDKIAREVSISRPN